MKKRGKGEGSLYKTIQKIKRKNILDEECAICKECTNREKCNNRESYIKCDKCKNCKEECLKYCDRFYCKELWIGQATVGGKRKTVSIGKKQGIVNSKKTTALSKIQTNSYVDKNKTTLGDILKSIIEDKHNANITSERSYKRDLDTLYLIEKLSETLVKMPMQKITEEDLSKALYKMTEYSNSSINKVYIMLRGAFRKSISKNIITSNPMADIVKIKSKKQSSPVEALTVEEHQKLLQVINNEKINDKYKNIILVMLETGMRIGEVLALEIKDINIFDKTIHVQRTLTRDKEDKIILGCTTKTYAGNRKIILTDNTLRIIKRCMISVNPNEYDCLFWNNKNNCFISPSEVNCYLKRLNDKYKIANHLHNHMLRHTYATRCIESGMNAVVLSKILGHSDTSITLNTYTSVFNLLMMDKLEQKDAYLAQNNLIAL